MFPTYRLEVLLCSRPHKIDELYAKFEQARAQNRKLEAEAAIFAAIRRAYAGCTQGTVPHAKKAGSMALLPAKSIMKLRRESRTSKPHHRPLGE